MVLQLLEPLFTAERNPTMQRRPNPSPIRYTVTPIDPAAHRFEVRLSVTEHAPDGQRFALPAWIPGSYMIRDFARYIVTIRAEADGKPVRLEKLDKHTWQASPVPPAIVLEVVAEVYAWDLSVRGAHLDETHGFFNGTSLFLRVVGQEAAPCLVDLRPPAGDRFRAWRIATALPTARGLPGAARRYGFGFYRAANYDELIDHPVEMGDFTLVSFSACGVQHDVALTGKHDADIERLASDLQRLCEWQIRFFGEPAPFARYVFLVTALGEGYGGLEHRASTALLCARSDLPYRGMTGVPDAYLTLLGLCSHEYFHNWNIKRIKPARFMPYDLDRESHTSLLWAFEGFTSYYDDLVLLRCGIIDGEQWLKTIAKTISNVARTPGRHVQSLAASSFDAWTKFYRPDENTPNAVVSYYAKGALLALTLDLTLRRRSNGAHSLDDVMTMLWQRFGKPGIGIEETTIRDIAEELCGGSLKRFFDDYVDGTSELPLERLLTAFGVRLEWTTATPNTVALDAKTVSADGGIKLSTVFAGGAAQRAGLAAGDLVIAIDGLRVTNESLEQRLTRYRADTPITIHAFRRDELFETTLVLSPTAKDSARLAFSGKNVAARKRWLGA